MSDKECFDFLRSINYDKQYFIDKGWTKKYWSNNTDRNARWWPQYYTDDLTINDNDPVWFPPGFKLQEGYGNDLDDFPSMSCANCANSRSETNYGCRLPEIRVVHDSSVLKGEDYVAPGHSNPVFIWSQKYAPHAVCDYFKPRGLMYYI